MQVLVPSQSSDYLELARTQRGKLYRKHILTKGPLRHPVTGEIIDVNDEMYAKMQENFQKRVVDIVQVPLAGDMNEHTEAPDRNVGEVLGLEVEGDKMYAVIDARKNADDFGSTILGASAMINLDYKDAKSGQKVGPTLVHVCATNRPYVTDLEDYQELVSLSADSDGDTVLLTPQEAPSMEITLEDLEAVDPDLLVQALSNYHGIDVGQDEAQLSRIARALEGATTLKLSAGDSVSADEIIGAIAEMNDENLSLTARVDKLEKEGTEAEVDRLVSEARILPAQRDAMLDLALTNREMFDKLVPEQPLLALSREDGVDDRSEYGAPSDIDAEIERLAKLANGADA